MKIKELRNKMNLTQKQLAEKINITSQQCSYYELEKRQPDIETIIKMADFFRVSIDYLLDRKNITNNKENTYSEEETQLINNYRLLKEDTKKALFIQITELAKIKY